MSELALTPLLTHVAAGASVLDDLVRTRSRADIADNIRRWHACFSRHGLQAGDTVALLLRNRVEFIEVLLAGLEYGLRVVPLNWHLNTQERRQLLVDCQPALLVSERYFAASLASDYPLELLETLTSMQQPIEPSQTGYIMLYTGGTTGLPKGVIRKQYHTLQELREAWQQLGHSAGLSGQGVHLVTGPLYHAAPLYFALYDFLNGAPLLIMPFWQAKMALALVEQRKVRRCHLVPTQMVHLLRLPEAVRARADIRSLELILHGAAAIAGSVKQQMIDWFGPVLEEYWGGSESGMCTRISSEDWLQHPGSVGKALAHYQLRIVDMDDGHLLAAGEAGLVQIRHASGHLPFRYHGQAEDEDEWFDLGDIGYLDDAGYLYLCDRLKNKVISGGVNIYPAEVEKYLLALDAIADVAVLGLPDPVWGECLVAAIVLARPVGELAQQVRVHLQQLSAFKRPRIIYVFDDLQRLPSGKLRNHELQQRIAGHDYQQVLPL